MLWIVQNNLYNENGYTLFLDALKRLEVKHQVVKVVPFTSKLLPPGFDSMQEDFDAAQEPVIDTGQKIIVFGAISLTRIAGERGWTPGSYLTDKFDFEVWRDGFGVENTLNADAVTGTVANIEVPSDWDWRFVRPVHDTKALAGEVMSRHDFHDWRVSILGINPEDYDRRDAPLHRETPILVAPLQKIYNEWRMFVVDGTVVTSSQYKSGRDVVGYSDDQTDPAVTEFAQSMVDRWRPVVIGEPCVDPARAYVIDIADTPNGLKVIEINNINSSGFYGADTQKMIMALEDLERE